MVAKGRGALVAIAVLALLVAAQSALAGVKEDNTQQLISLAQQMRQMKAAGQAGSSAYAALLQQYAGLSAALGGDDPGAWSSLPQPYGMVIEGTGPATPPNCVGATTSGANNTPVPIPDNNPAGVTSTINIAGAGTYLWNVDLTTFITHTFAGDIDMTLTSPGGTVVTISTDNGSGNDNVFNGTLWTDIAGATNPPGPVTDNVYANNVVETPLSPEEPFSAFRGENPNGTWTLFIADDAGADTGTLNSWSLDLTTFAAAPTNDPPINGANNTAVPIPDNNPAGVTSTINLGGSGFICGANLTTFITHTFAGDIDMTLTSPGGTVVTISTDNGSGNDNVFNGTLWTDIAGATNPPGPVTDNVYANNVVETPLSPEEPLDAFVAGSPSGTWTLFVADDAGADTGTLNSWSLAVTTCSCAAACVLTAPPDVTVSNTPGQCGAVVNYPAPGSTGNCGTITCTPASGSSFPVGTTLVTCTSSVGGSSASFNVTVNDTEAPTITCPADISADLPPGSTGQNVAFADPVVSDNCPGVFAPSCVPASGDVFPVGQTSVLCDTIDAAGNINSCNFLVTLGAVTVLEVPTISSLGLLALALLLAAAALVALRRHG